MKYARGFASKAWNDSYNNCFASFGPEGAGVPTIAICGHADEIGLMVNHFDDKGFVYCKAIGGIDTGSIVGKRVRFNSSVPGVQNPVIGLIGATAIHLQDKSVEGKVRKIHELFIDIGATSADEAKARLAIGDAGVFLDGFMQLSDDIVVARALDNRIGTWAVAETLRLLRPHMAHLEWEICAVANVQEEVGLLGARQIAYSLNPAAALVVDVTHATDYPTVDPRQHGEVRMGKGPTLTHGGCNHVEVVGRLEAIASAKGIPLQHEAMSASSGTDTDVIFWTRGGIPSALISLPNRYMHSPVELVNLRDLEYIPELMAAFALSLRKDEEFKVRI